MQHEVVHWRGRVAGSDADVATGIGGQASHDSIGHVASSMRVLWWADDPKVWQLQVGFLLQQAVSTGRLGSPQGNLSRTSSQAMNIAIVLSLQMCLGIVMLCLKENPSFI